MPVVLIAFCVQYRRRQNRVREMTPAGARLQRLKIRARFRVKPFLNLRNPALHEAEVPAWQCPCRNDYANGRENNNSYTNQREQVPGIH